MRSPLLTHRARRMVALAGFLVLAIALAAYFGLADRRVSPPAGPSERITICYSWPIGQLVGIAKGRDFFAGQGLSVKLRPYLVGRDALAAMLAGACDLATTSNTPIVFMSFERQDFRIIATTRTQDDYHQVVARKDRGIFKPGDLKGKRVGVLRATSAHFFLYRFLLEQGLTTDDVSLVFGAGVSQVQSALADGSVDAVALWQPHIEQLQKSLGEQDVTFTAPGLVITNTNLVARTRLIREHPQVIAALLRALVPARDLARADPAAAMDALALASGVSRAEVRSSWYATHELSLSQTLLLSLEDEARWAQQSGLVDKRAAPNYLDFIYLEGLKAVAPEAVTVLQ